MAEQLKAMYDEPFLRAFGDKVHAVYSKFDTILRFMFAKVLQII